GVQYEQTLGRIFDLYSAALPRTIQRYEERFPKQPDDTDRVYRSTIRAKALDSVRGMLPAATVSNTGIYASGQAFEGMLLRMRQSPLAEVRTVADMMLAELKEVIPVFLQRVEQPSRGGAWSDYLRDTRESMQALAAELLRDD